MENSCIRIFADHAQIKICKSRLKTAQQSFTGVSTILALASNETRLKIIYLLNEEGRLCPCDLSDILAMSIPAVSQHLRKLKDGGIVQTKKEGQTIFYSLTQNKLKFLKLFLRHIDQGKQKLQTT